MVKLSVKLVFAVISAVLGIGAAGAFAPAGAHTNADRAIFEPITENLPNRIRAAIAADRLGSVSMAIVFGDDIIFQDAFGYADVENRIPATTETIYPIASVTKVFVATMLAQLVERGVVGLEDPLQKYLPEYQPQSPFIGARPTTLRQLAAHTSGLPRDAPVNFWCNFAGFVWLVTSGQTEMTSFVDCQTLLASLQDIELVYEPEVHSHYSNLNFQLLGLALERACGQSLMVYIKSEILTPLGMGDTGFALDPEQKTRLARGYVCTGPETPMMPAPEYDLGCAVYSGGLYSKARDMARFVALQFQEESSDRPPVLGEGTLRRMRTPQSIQRRGIYECYGLGWYVGQIDGHNAIEHNGALLGYHAHVSAVPDLKLGIVALSNTKNYMWRQDACKDLARSILADLADAAAVASPKPEKNPTAVDLAALWGRYALPGEAAHLVVSAAVAGIHVTLSEVPDFSADFVPVAPHAFCFATDPAREPMLFFSAAPDGKIDKVTFLSHTFYRVE